jgi:DNA adenine methylase
MKYMGSKNRIAKYILPIILKDRKEGQWYVEPFCGGCNTIDKVKGPRMAIDSHPQLIAMYKAIQAGWEPPKLVSEWEYSQANRYRDTIPAYLLGYIGFNLSFGAKWFGGYARHNDGGKRCSSTEAYNNVTKQIPYIKDILFYHAEYNAHDNYPAESIIYCDPPYKGTTKYNSTIDYPAYYQWLRDMKAQGHTIFCSEYSMPEDFTCVWSKPVTVNLTNQTSALTKVEKLFTLL